MLQLHQLQALDCFGEITCIGRQMSAFPLAPHLSRMLIQAGSEDCHCLHEMTTICAMLCVDSVWNQPHTYSRDRNRDQRQSYLRDRNRDHHHHHRRGAAASVPIAERSAEEERREIIYAGFRHEYGDFLTLLKVYEAYERSGFSYDWCVRSFLNARPLKMARQIR